MKPTIKSNKTHHEVVNPANGVVLARIPRGTGSKLRALSFVKLYTR